MQTHEQILPTPEALLEAWKTWHSLIGVDRIQTEADYDRVTAILDRVVDVVRDDEQHPLLPVMEDWWKPTTPSIIPGPRHRLSICCAT